LSVRLYLRRSDGNARTLFLASIIYLPLLLGLMVLDRGPLGN
jgi:heme O synthase-like polyprenyltransferase